MARIAKSARCAAIAGPTSYAGLDLGLAMFDVAASSETIRLVATLGPSKADGAIDLAPERLLFDDEKLPQAADVRPRIGTLNAQGEPVFHEQSALLAAALDLVGKAEIAAGSQIVSTLSPASFVSLVTGPVASLLSGAPLTLFGPFDAASFVTTIDRVGPAHCVIPAAILPDLERAETSWSWLLGRLGYQRDRSVERIVLLRHPGGTSVVLEQSSDMKASVQDITHPAPPAEVHGRDESGIVVRRRSRADLRAAPILSGEVLAPVPPRRQAERSWR